MKIKREITRRLRRNSQRNGKEFRVDRSLSRQLEKNSSMGGISSVNYQQDDQKINAQEPPLGCQ